MASPAALIPTIDGALPRRRDVARRKATVRRVLRLLIAALAVTALLQLAYHVAIAPGMRLSGIVVDTPLPVSEADVLRMAGIAIGDRFSSLRVAEIALRLESFPDVASAIVTRQFPGTLLLTLHARDPVVALMATNQRGNSVTFTVDGDGVLYRAGVPPAVDLPLLSGLTVGEVEIGSRVGPQLLPLVQDLARLAEQEPYLTSLVSQVEVRPRAGALPASGFDAALYTVHFAVPLLFGESITAAAVSEGLLVLEALTRAGGLTGIDFVDMRAGPPVLVAAADAVTAANAVAGER